MRVKHKISSSCDVPFTYILWNGMEALVTDLIHDGWDVSVSKQTNWRVQSDNEYYYFRWPKTRMIMRVTRKKGALHSTYEAADFFMSEKVMPREALRAIQSQEQILRNQEAEVLRAMEEDGLGGIDDQAWFIARDMRQRDKMLAGMSVAELLDEVSKRQKDIKIKRSRPSAEIINLDEYLESMKWLKAN